MKMIIILKTFRILAKIKQEMTGRTELQSGRSTLYSNSIIQTRHSKVKESFLFTMCHKKTKLLIIRMEPLLNTQMLFNQTWGLFLDYTMILI
jgi:hypothetical protein